MFRKLTCAVAGLLIVAGVGLAQNQAGGQAGQAGQPGQGQTMGGRILGGEGGKFTYNSWDAKGGKFGTQGLPFNAGANVKVYRMQGDKRVPVEGGLQGDAFKNIGEKGLYATWQMKGNQISEITLWPDEQGFQKGFKGLQAGGINGKNGGGGENK